MTNTTDTAALRTALAERLPADLPERWRAAFRRVERHRFAPRFALHDSTTGTFTHFDVTDPDPQHRRAALAAAYSDDTLITRFDDNGAGLSSSTEPSLMASMLAALDARPDHRILEVGTGTGYHAALLCAGCGDARVTTIDIDSTLVTAARGALAEAGYAPTLVCGDGAAGVPERAPFDRIIATCGVDRVPVAWLAQLAAGGAILVNVSKGIALLRDTGDGAVAGRFRGAAGFMPLRSVDYPAQWSPRRIIEQTDARPDSTATATVPEGLDFPTAAFFTNLVAERGRLVLVSEGNAVISYRWVHPVSRSWARVDLPDAKVRQAGPRRLWDELAPILDAWQAAGRPGIDRFGLTVRRDGAHHLWLDTPASTVAELV